MQCYIKTINFIYCRTTACRCISKCAAKVKLKDPVPNIQSRSVHSSANINTEKLSSAFIPALKWSSSYLNRPNEVKGTGKRQSPIDIDTDALRKIIMPPLKWSCGYFCRPDEMEVASDGHTVAVTVSHSSPMTICGGPLLENYKLEGFHFHWGCRNEQGSEHTVDGKSFVMELHAVHTMENLSVEEAKLQSDGIAVIGYFVEIKPTDNARGINIDAFDLLTASFENMTVVNEKVKLKSPFPLENLLVPFHHKFISYAGSLTTPPYSESVIWILCGCTLSILQEQLDKFRELYKKGLVHHRDNFRPVQELHKRKLFFAESW